MEHVITRIAESYLPQCYLASHFNAAGYIAPCPLPDAPSISHLQSPQPKKVCTSADRLQMLALETTLKGWAGYGSTGQVLEPLVLDHFNTSQEGHILVLATQAQESRAHQFIVT
jgi:hypothetical protein